MPKDHFAGLRGLSDDELVRRVRVLAARERGGLAEFVAHLAELGTREVHLRAGHGSLFAYCREALALSEADAYIRIEVARTARRFPLVLELLEAGSVNLTTIRLVGPHLNSENFRDVLESARGKRKAIVEEIVARIAPHPDVPASIRRLPAPRPAAWRPLDPAAIPTDEGRGQAPSPPPSPAPAPLPPGAFAVRPATIAPLSPDRYRVQITIGGETLEKLRLAKDMLRHALPWGDDAAVLDRALTALLADLARRKFAATEAPHPSRGSAPGSRHVPAEVKRAVFLRDLGRCAFVGTTGRRCGERAFVEFHHLRPFAAGGETTLENIQLRCRAHNAYEARAYFAPSLATPARSDRP
ncbi:MAG TPA: hypothetical protein VMV21_05425 [Vicinamibacteria bacterium]|nr:hypothetical protein [Vicinamibacteria bacterium]